MTTYGKSQKENGVVLLLILGFMAMFAVMVLTFIMITSNLSDSANSSVTDGTNSTGSSPSLLGVSPSADAKIAIKAALVGSKDNCNPIGPFGVFENLYGESGNTDNDPLELTMDNELISFCPATMELIFQISVEDTARNIQNLFDQSGTVLTFGDMNDSGIDPSMVKNWNSLVSCSSVTVVKKEVRDYENGRPCGVMTVLPSAELKAFLELETIRDWITINGNALLGLTGARLNRPAFSGTGAGGLSPQSTLDGQQSPDDTNSFRLPFAFWANAAAPDLTPFDSDEEVYDSTDLTGKELNFQTFLKHLASRDYRPFAYNNDSETRGDHPWLPYFDTDSSQWIYNDYTAHANETPIRMNASYTAPDGRNLFLAHYKKSPTADDAEPTDIIPSYHRPEFLLALLDKMEDLRIANSDTPRLDIDWLSVFRKMTPRPLPLDHWNFSGENNNLPALDATDVDGLTNGNVDVTKQNMYDKVTDLAQKLSAQLPNQWWDVDNDNDGVNEGIWIPSGLPIRSATDGTPYATFYSYTILDMDGRININTAGNWDQMPNVRYSLNPYLSLSEMSALTLESEFQNSIFDYRSPWFDVEIQDNALWKNDTNAAITDPVRRGAGFGPTEVNLIQALNALGVDGFDANATTRIAANMIWNRNQSAEKPHQLNAFNELNSDNLIGWNFKIRSSIVQPGKYLDEDAQSLDNSDAHRLYWNFTDGIYTGNLSVANAPELFTFPWRGKMRVSNYNLAAQYYPTFDFNGSGLRTYDVLGNDFYTFAPKQSENPYLNNPYSASYGDTPYQATLLESLLRSHDYDTTSLNLDLLKDLTDDTDGTQLRQFFDAPEIYDSARLNLTTISSDVPTPALVFPFGPEIDGDGAFGIRDLIRRCVIMEFYKKNKPIDENLLAADHPDYVAPSVATGALIAAKTDAEAIIRKKYDLASNFDFSTSESLNDEVRRLEQSLTIYVLYDNLSGFDYRPYNGEDGEDGESVMTLDTSTLRLFTNKIDALTDELFSLLPEDTQNGRRLDLNALSHKASWLDRSYQPSTSSDSTPQLYLGYTTYQGESKGIVSFEGEFRGFGNDDIPKVYDNNNQIQNGDTPIEVGPANFHRHGLIERMKFARSLYVLLSVLTYQERNAKTVAEFYLADMTPDTIHDYIEGPYKGKINDLLSPTDEEKALADELFANRLAQWCVNFVDFTDPDATMTPFYYDPDPFDGWWVVDNNWMTTEDLRSAIFTCSEILSNYYADFYDVFEDMLSTPDLILSGLEANSLQRQKFTHLVNGEYFDADASYAQNLANWLEGKNAGGTSVDFGFRRVWGMERPDLLLTETLSFHDLGIADTVNEAASEGKLTVDDDGDKHFDQVRRPQGSSYLELYCAANPNIPQSPELYDFDTDNNLWKLDLSRMTPRVSGDGSPYQNLTFPVWRIAISASCAPRDEDTEDSSNNNRQVRKKANSVLERLVGAEDAADAMTFSFQTRQFNGIKEVDTGLTNDQVSPVWSGLDICASNILGPNFVHQDGTTEPDLSKEVEIDRIVWMTRPLKSDGKTWELVGDYPDASRLFWRIYEQPLEVPSGNDEDKRNHIKSYLLPNQYMVIGPEDERSIGSLRRNSTIGDDAPDISPAPQTHGYFGLPSYAKILLNYSVRNNDDEVTSITPVLNPVNGSAIRVGTYNGITGTGQTISYRRGLNISEPLWSNGTDPYSDSTKYPKSIPTTTVTFNRNKYLATKEFVDGDESTVVPDVPFDLPSGWETDAPSNSSVTKKSPIAEDKLFGLGTVPGYRSAFVQRVADPNQPYHPLLNPYITVDWNMMDLTVFNGETIEISGDENSASFVTDTENTSDYIESNNRFKELQSSVFTDGVPGYSETDLTGNSTVFSSRQWGNLAQIGFYPTTLHSNRANLWARPVNRSGFSTNAGLEPAVGQADLRKYNTVGNKMILLSDTEKSALVIPFAPKHTLGWYNNRGDATFVQQNDGPADAGSDKNWYDNLETNWFVNGLNTYSPYLGSPRAVDANANGTYGASPFEHLVWNDAPLSNPTELMLVPASHPARFGMEFIRNSGGNGTDQSLSLANLYSTNVVESNGVLGRSLGSSYFDGTERTNTFGYGFIASGNSEATPFFGPYLNFFNSVDGGFTRTVNSSDPDNPVVTWNTSLGQSLNLAKLFDFVTIPSPYVNTRQALTAWNTTNQQHENLWQRYNGAQDEALYSSTLREPGKINVNTMRSPAWVGLFGSTNTATTPFNDSTDNFLAGRVPLVEDTDNPGTFTSNPNGGFVPFQPMQTASLAATMRGTNGLLPVDSSFFARNLANTTQSLLNNTGDVNRIRGNIYAATDEIQKLSGLTTNRSNVFATWLTIGYFQVEKAIPGVNMPMYDPDGEPLAVRIEQEEDIQIVPIFVDANGVVDDRVVRIDDNLQPYSTEGLLTGLTMKLFSPKYKYAEYYKAIYPDGYTYGKELGSGGDGGVTRTRGFYLIDRSIPTDFRRGRSKNWENAILLERVL